MMNEPARVAVTGHQPQALGGHGDDVAHALTELAASWLSHNAVAEVISGMAAGWDVAVARAALDLGIPLVAALPYAEHGRNWPDDARADLHRMLEKARHVHVHASEPAPGCYTRRDRWVIERGTLVLALWSGVEGGTGRAVAMAHELGKPVVNLWSAYRLTAP